LSRHPFAGTICTRAEAVQPGGAHRCELSTDAIDVLAL